MEVLGDDGVVAELGDVERENGAAVEGLFEVNESADRRLFAGPPQLLMMKVDEILHHVLDGFGAGVEGVNLQPRIAHGQRSQLVQETVILQTLRRQKIGIGRFIVSG